ncbi:MAG: GYD domain-containing protein [Streptosporangiaceae bacterium]
MPHAIFSSNGRPRGINSRKGYGTGALRQGPTAASPVDLMLECLYWQLATYDGFAIWEMPDTVSAYAVTTAVAKTGAFKIVETHELFTQEQLGEILCLAGDTAQVCEVPGQTALVRHQ